MLKQKINIIVGPTASGKSGLALKIAQDKNGQIVNADAFQVYKDLRILTARPTLEDEKLVPHYLYGYADCQTQENVQSWLEKVAKILSTLSYPIVVGGTGMYINALINGINEMPEIPDEIRQKVRQLSLNEVRSLLKGKSIYSDPQRQRRALEIYLTTGKPITYFQNQPKKKIVRGIFDITLVQPERDMVYSNIEKRLTYMMQNGAVEEVNNLLKIKAKGGVTKAIGVKEITQYLRSKCSLEEATNQILLATRHYAKRQMTWFRHQIKPNNIIIL